MGESDDENFATFGSALEPLDEENLPRKMAITVEEQYALDPQGRRRFHGAFTGGFSAGYFNSVGTRDGWRPQQFKSSRSSKADGVSQRPEDFMDEEDTGEFGIAPTAIRANSDFTDHGRRGAKRERQRQDNDGPIPGIPVLRDLLKPVKDTVGVTLLKKMGWRPGQGIGPRVTKSEKVRTRRKNDKLKIYGCSLPNQREIADSGDSESEISDDQSEVVLFAPDDYEPFVCNPKDNYFGIGYTGLDRRPVLSSHVNLFEEPTAFKLNDKNKKLSIRGQAFGVGAFEADDEDIYQRDDMSRYDFSLGPSESSKGEKTRSRSGKDRASTEVTLEGFVPAMGKRESKKIFEAPELPNDFKAIHAIRKSRFNPPIETINNNGGKVDQSRPNLTANDRAKILNDPNVDKSPSIANKSDKSSVACNIIERTLNLRGREKMAEKRIEESQKPASWMEKLTSKNFVSGGVEGQFPTTGSLKKLEDFQSSSQSKGNFKPFVVDPEKQSRFEKFVEFGKNNDRLSSLQPLSMTEWEREQEKDEFVGAARMLEESRLPVDILPSDEKSEKTMKMNSKDSTMGGKFVEGGKTMMALPEVTSDVERMKNAARMKLFGKLTRERDAWQPATLVCKRFNIPEPRSGCSTVVKQSKRYSVFDSLEFCETSNLEDSVSAENSKQSSVTRENARVHEAAILSSSSRWPTVPASTKTTPCCLDISDIKASSSKSNVNIPSFEASYEKIFGNSSISNAMEDHDKMALTNKRENSNAVDEETAIVKEVERKDLFKAIFLSSSEDSESDNGDHDDDSEAVKSLLIGKKPGDLNLQRNTSPPRGIFAKLDLDELTKPLKIIDPLRHEGAAIAEIIVDNTNDERKDGGEISKIPEVELSTDMYGPVLPKKISRDEDKSMSEEASSSKDSQFSRPIFRSVVVTTKGSDVTDRVKGEWVERGRVKKSKRDKHKHRHKEKERSKHKRKSKKSKR